MTDTILCSTNELEDNIPTGFTISIDGNSAEIIVIKTAHGFFAWRNVCPHQSRLLNWAPGKFLMDNKNQLVCGAHGACFNIESGLCTSGPCSGESLTPFNIKLTEKTICY